MRQRAYEIQVEGHLGDEWHAWFAGLDLRYETGQPGQTAVTVLSAALDQAALHGVLMRIGHLGLPLLSVRRIRSNPGVEQGEGSGRVHRTPLPGAQRPERPTSR
jgi:hypothetical protein